MYTVLLNDGVFYYPYLFALFSALYRIVRNVQMCFAVNSFSSCSSNGAYFFTRFDNLSDPYSYSIKMRIIKHCLRFRVEKLN